MSSKGKKTTRRFRWQCKKGHAVNALTVRSVEGKRGMAKCHFCEAFVPVARVLIIEGRGSRKAIGGLT